MYIITVLISLFANSHVCQFWVNFDCYVIMGNIFLVLDTCYFFYWILDIVSFILLGAGYFCIDDS